VYWFPFVWSQRDDFSSLAFTAHCEFSIFPAEPLRQERSIE